jgi:hypothetical protein
MKNVPAKVSSIDTIFGLKGKDLARIGVDWVI